MAANEGLRCGSSYNKLLYSDCLPSLKLPRFAPIISNCDPPSRVVFVIESRGDSLARKFDDSPRIFSPVLDLVLSINHVLPEIPCMLSLLKAGSFSCTRASGYQTSRVLLRASRADETEEKQKEREQETRRQYRRQLRARSLKQIQ